MKKYLLPAFILLSISLEAQHYHVRKFTTEQGLPGNDIFDIDQDKNGVLWIYNGRSYSSYDGNKFRNFISQTDLSTNSALHHFDGKTRYICPQGIVTHDYFGFTFSKIDSSLLYTYISDRGATKSNRSLMDKDGYCLIYKYPKAALKKDTLRYFDKDHKLHLVTFGLPGGQSFNCRISSDNNEKAWVRLSYADKDSVKKLDLFYFEKGKLQLFKKGLQDEENAGVFVTSKNDVYLYTNQKLILVSDKETKTTNIKIDYKSNNASNIAEDKKGDLWMGYYKGLVKISNGKVEYIENPLREVVKDKIQEFDENGKVKYVDVFDDARFTMIAVDKEDNIVNGNEVYNGKKFTTIDLNGVNYFLDLFVDRENQIWYATFDGLFCAKAIDIDVLDISGKISFVSKDGRSIITSRSGDYGDLRLYIYYDLVQKDSVYIKAIDQQSINFSVFETAKRIIFVASGELYAINQNKFEKTKLVIPNNKTKLHRYHKDKVSPDQYIKLWNCDKNGFAWGTTANYGYVLKTDGIQYWFYGKEDGLTDTIHGVYNEANHCVVDYLFSSEKIYNVLGDKLEPVKNSKLNIQAAAITPIGTSDGAFYFLVSRYGKIKEVYICRIKNNVLEKLNVKVTPPANLGFAFSWAEQIGKNFISLNIRQCYSKLAVGDPNSVSARPMIIDPEFIPQLNSYHFKNNKLFSFNDAGYIQVFHIKDVNNDSLPAPVLIKDFFNFVHLSYRDTAGSLYATTQSKKSIRVNTKGSFLNNYHPAVHFLKLNYTNKGEISNITNFETHISVPYHFDPLIINYKAVCLSDGGKLRYKYKLVGINENWTETEEDHLTYSSLPPGSYTLEVIACNNNGTWTEESTKLFFEILPPWQRTWWAYTTYIFAFFAAGRGYLKNRTKKLEKEKQKLEATVDERTAEVVKQKHLLEEKNKEVIDSITYAKRIQQSLMPTEKYISRVLGKKK